MRVLGQPVLDRAQIARNQNMSPIQKADLALSDITSGGGYLTAENARNFLLIMIKQAKLLQDCQVIPMKSHTHNLDKMRFTGDILNVAEESTELASGARSKPTLTRSTIIAKAFKGEVRLSDFDLEDQIEGAAFANSVQTAMAQILAQNIEKICLLSDTTGSGTAPYKQFEGLFKLAATNVVDAGDTNLNKDILRDMLRAMPQEFMSDRSKLMFYTSIAADIDYRDAFANRQTIGGDSFMSDYAPVYYNGVPLKTVPLFPENVGTSTHCTHVVLMDPKNFAVGIWRRLRIETDKNIRAGVISIVASLRMGANFVEETAVVEADNVKAVA